MGIASSLSKLARSPQGRKAFQEATRLAKDPKTRAKIQDAKAQLQQRGKKRP
jgi:predicted RNA polymerase sigma factor